MSFWGRKTDQRQVGEIDLGDKVKDQITGFEGVVTGHTRYITGCDAFCLQPQGLDKDGKIHDAKWIDENRLVMVEAKAVVLDPVPVVVTPVRAAGGPHDNEAPIR